MSRRAPGAEEVQERVEKSRGRYGAMRGQRKQEIIK